MTLWRLGFGVLLAAALLPWAPVHAAAQKKKQAEVHRVMPHLPLPPVLARTPPMTDILPQDDLLPVDLTTIYLNREDIDQALVTVELGDGADNPQWLMSPTQREVLLDTLLQFMPQHPRPEDAIWPKLNKPEPKYRGVRVAMKTVFGKRFEAFTIFEGTVRTAGGNVVVSDYGRRLEYWMFGTSRVRRDQLVGAHVLPVLTFEQCRLLGQQIVETRPRQCLLPDNNLLLETPELPTLKSARIRDFEGCLKDGKALIYTFPRRCLASGGRVFTEPPKVYEIPEVTPRDAPLVAPTALSVPTSGTMPGITTGVGLNLNSVLTGPLPSNAAASPFAP